MRPSWPGTIADCIHCQIEKTPSSIALIEEEVDVSYQELADSASSIVSSLQRLGIAAGHRILVVQEPGKDQISTMLAAFKLGAVYVPVDLRQPVERLRDVLEECRPNIILCHAKTIVLGNSLSSGSGIPPVLDVSNIELQYEALTLSPIVNPTTVAIILYTSGSTGKPKGIALSHANLCHHLEGMTTTLKLDNEVILQQSALTFDLAISQALMALCTGGSLVLVSQSQRRDIAGLPALMARKNVTLTLAIPSEYASWLRFGCESLRTCNAWKVALSAGEVLTSSLVSGFSSVLGSMPQIINVYGAAEGTIASHCTPINSPSDGGAISVGKPLPNYATYIMDEKLRPLPIGYPGEICVGGCGVSIGYLNDDVLTSSKYVPDAYASDDALSRGWTRIHRTGDRGRLAKDGSLCFEGRIGNDTLIKLRGIRVELEDVESVIIRQAKGILEQAVVSVRGDPEFLIAHVVFSQNGKGVNRDSFLRSLLSSLPLPQYMRPAILIPIDRMPLNAHGKTDRRAIFEFPLPEFSPAIDGDRRELTQTERALKALWDETLPSELTDMTDLHPGLTFFDVGGNSLLLITLRDLIARRLSVVLPLADLYEFHTLELMAQRIETATRANPLDWEKEASVDNLALASASPKFRDPDNGLVVLMTGATGALGSRLLKHLLKDNRFSHIHCIAVRQPTKTRHDSEKLSYYGGDLGAQHLGLPVDKFEELAADVDVILHLGANRSFWDNYRVMRGSNVDSTKALVALAAPRKVPIHFISSGGLFFVGSAFADRKTISDLPEAPCDSPPPNESDGYLKTKWVSEKILENAAKQLNLPVTIHRPMPVRSVKLSTGNSLPALEELRNITQAMNIKSVSPVAKGHFDLIKTDELAMNIISTIFKRFDAFQYSSSTGDATQVPISYVHHHSSVRLTTEDFGLIWSHNQRSTESIESISGPEWIGRVKAAGFSYIIASQDLQFLDEVPNRKVDGTISSRR